MADLYNLSSHYWEGDAVALHASTATGDIFATIPLSFLSSNGVNTWKYVLNLANMLVDRVPNCPGAIETFGGDVVSLEAAPAAGDYVFKHSGA